MIVLLSTGAKNINFQELAADLAQITFDYPFQIPPYFACALLPTSCLACTQHLSSTCAASQHLYSLLHPKQHAVLSSHCSCRLIIRAISVLEGIALVANPEFAIVDESFPFVAKKMLTDQSPRLQAALQYMVHPCQTVKASMHSSQHMCFLQRAAGGAASLTGGR